MGDRPAGPAPCRPGRASRIQTSQPKDPTTRQAMRTGPLLCGRDGVSICWRRFSASNIAQSVRDRLLNRARCGGEDFQALLTRYALERLMYRLSPSNLRERLTGVERFYSHALDWIS